MCKYYFNVYVIISQNWYKITVDLILNLYFYNICLWLYSFLMFKKIKDRVLCTKLVDDLNTRKVYYKISTNNILVMKYITLINQSIVD